MKEAEIQKPCANLTICTGAERLSNDNEGQGNNTLCGWETEPVKLIRSQGGKLTEIAVQLWLIHRTGFFWWGLNCFYNVL